MAVDVATQTLTHIALLLLVGLIVSVLAKKLEISNILLLILTGLGLSAIVSKNILFFDSTFLVAVGVLTLVMVVFDGSSRFELKSVNLFSLPALQVTTIFLLLNLFFITTFTSWMIFGEFSIEALLLSLLFAFIMTGTDPGSVFILLKNKTNKVISFLEIEAIINTPIMVIFPFLIIEILNNLQTGDVTSAILGQTIPLLQQIVVGVGAGMVLGIIVFKSMKKVYSQRFSPIGIITAALLAYILSENLGGNGVLAVATLGIFFGNIYVKEKENLQEFSSMLGSSLVILVFILIGFIIDVHLSLQVILKALVLFIILIITRLTSLQFVLRKKAYGKEKPFSNKEKWFMALSMPKGIAAAVVAFSLSVFTLEASIVPMMNTILELIIIMMIYSLICSTIIDRFSKKLIKINL